MINAPLPQTIGAIPPLSPSEIRLQDLPAGLQSIEIVRPIPHHPDTLVPMGAARIGSSNIIGFDMGQLARDGVRMPLAHFVQKRAGCGPEPMGRHLVFPEAQPS